MFFVIKHQAWIFPWWEMPKYTITGQGGSRDIRRLKSYRGKYQSSAKTAARYPHEIPCMVMFVWLPTVIPSYLEIHSKLFAWLSIAR